MGLSRKIKGHVIGQPELTSLVILTIICTRLWVSLWNSPAGHHIHGVQQRKGPGHSRRGGRDWHEWEEMGQRYSSMLPEGLGDHGKGFGTQTKMRASCKQRNGRLSTSPLKALLGLPCSGYKNLFLWPHQTMTVLTLSVMCISTGEKAFKGRINGICWCGVDRGNNHHRAYGQIPG